MAPAADMPTHKAQHESFSLANVVPQNRHNNQVLWSAIEGAARNEAYAATKGAVISMMKSIAVEHARYGVRANSVAPGFTVSDGIVNSGRNGLEARKAAARVR